jgi:DNA repair photolyase
MPLVTDIDSEMDAVVDACGEAGVGHVFGAMLRMRTDIWERMKVALQLLGVKDGTKRYMQIYNFREPLDASYVACDKEYAKKVLDALKTKVSERGMSTGFPDNVGPRAIDRSCLGQMTLFNYL